MRRSSPRPSRRRLRRSVRASRPFDRRRRCSARAGRSGRVARARRPRDRSSQAPGARCPNRARAGRAARRRRRRERVRVCGPGGRWSRGGSWPRGGTLAGGPDRSPGGGSSGGCGRRRRAGHEGSARLRVIGRARGHSSRRSDGPDPIRDLIGAQRDRRGRLLGLARPAAGQASHDVHPDRTVDDVEGTTDRVGRGVRARSVRRGRTRRPVRAGLSRHRSLGRPRAETGRAKIDAFRCHGSPHVGPPPRAGSAC